MKYSSRGKGCLLPSLGLGLWLLWWSQAWGSQQSNSAEHTKAPFSLSARSPGSLHGTCTSYQRTQSRYLAQPRERREEGRKGNSKKAAKRCRTKKSKSEIPKVSIPHLTPVFQNEAKIKTCSLALWKHLNIHPSCLVNYFYTGEQSCSHCELHSWFGLKFSYEKVHERHSEPSGASGRVGMEAKSWSSQLLKLYFISNFLQTQGKVRFIFTEVNDFPLNPAYHWLD